MQYYDEQLKALQEQVARKKKLESSLETLYSQKQELHSKVVDLEKIKIEEQEDVDKLESGSLAAFFYNVIGKKEEKLDKERQEAYAAAAKYNSAVRELEYVIDTIRSNEDELERLKGCEAAYQKQLEEKISLIKNANRAGAKAIMEIEIRMNDIKNQQKELKEAENAGKRARMQAENVMSALNEAESLGTWDVWGGGLLVDMAKHDALDGAQREVEELQLVLRSFKTELADVTIDADFKVNLDDFTRFGDWFFDNIFTDYNVLEQIRQSQDKIRAVANQIAKIMNNVNKLMVYSDAELVELQEKLEEKVIQTTI